MKFRMEDELKASGKLFLSNELIVSRIFVAWAFGCIVLFGFFGSGNLIMNLTKKINLYKEMRQLNYDLNVKLFDLSQLYEDLKVVRRYAPVLDLTIPKDLNTHSYLVSFTQAASDSGYGVKNFMPSTESVGGEVPILVTLLGAGDLSILVANLEALPRVTVIDSLEYSQTIDGSEVVLKLRIFNM